MTRARRTLLLHCFGDEFSYVVADGVKHHYVTNYPAKPKSIMLELGMKDVNLGFFSRCQPEVLRLRSGSPLEVSGDFLLSDGVPVVNFSRSFSEHLKSHYHLFRPFSAEVCFVVYWTNVSTGQEYAVLLCKLELCSI
ncbi:MAG: hypothetical protein II951_12475 [Bacteroidales bacterium]|nr:hypothetical protein [Bacteroidales bacterium]